MTKVTTYSTLGENGRLGNQMFQYSTLLAKARSEGYKFAIPDLAFENGKLFRYELLSAFPSLSADIVTRENIQEIMSQQRGIYKEPSFTYDQNFSLISPDVDLFGYFQSELYFKDYRSEIISEFSFNQEALTPASAMLQDCRKMHSSVCSLHIRRGDYLNLSDYHTNLDANYYSPAIQHIMSLAQADVSFLVFSDDVEWSKTFIQDRERVMFSESNDHLVDMCAMSLCDYHIIANSSFSWWGAWLSNSKCTLAPRQWFGPRGPAEWDSVYCQNWLIG